MSAKVFIISNGARTPVGLQAAPSAAAVRAAISGMREHPLLVDHFGEPVIGAFDRRLDPALRGPDRLLALSALALQEALWPLRDTRASSLRLPVYLGLPEVRPGFTSRDIAQVQERITRDVMRLHPDSQVTAFAEGHAAGMISLKKALDQIQCGLCEACLIGGVDSYFHPDTIRWLEENGQLASMNARSAFVPGEGAGFTLLMAEPTARQLGCVASAQLLTVALGQETKLIKSLDVCLGEGLTAAVQAAVSDVDGVHVPISDIVCDINGERYRGEEWGFVCLKLTEYFQAPCEYRSPADCWGDMGAASVPLFAMLACQAVARGYARGSSCLLWASSERGLRGAAVLASKSHEEGRTWAIA